MVTKLGTFEEPDKHAEEGEREGVDGVHKVQAERRGISKDRFYPKSD